MVENARFFWLPVGERRHRLLQIERLRSAGQQTPEIHPSQSEATADTLQRGTINKGIIQR